MTAPEPSPAAEVEALAHILIRAGQGMHSNMACDVQRAQAHAVLAAGYVPPGASWTDEQVARVMLENEQLRAQVAAVRALAEKYARGRGGPIAKRIRAALDSAAPEDGEGS